MYKRQLSDEIIDLGDAGDIFSKKWGGIKDIGKGIIATFKPLLPYIADVYKRQI